ncbi:MAG: phosphotransferase [Promethearchaeota archaeon]|jgi:hypothetical protein
MFSKFLKLGRINKTGHLGQLVNLEEISDCIRALTGVNADISSIEEIKGGTRKKVLLVKCQAPEDVYLLYVWYNENRYFTEGEDGKESYMFNLRAPELFAMNTEFLLDAGVRVPKILGRGTLRACLEYAFVEHIGGGNFLQYATSLPVIEKHSLLKDVNELLRTLHSQRRSYPGLLTDSPRRPTWTVDFVLQKVKHDVELISRWHKEIKAAKPRILDLLRQRRQAIQDRAQYNLVHGEAGPEHILVDHDGKPYLIDVEHVHFSNIESDHASLELLFGEDYRFLSRDDLDPFMMDFYRLALHIVYARGASQLVKKGYHDQDMAKRMMKKNLSAILALL